MEAINCVNCIVNRIPAKLLKNITRKESWNSINPYLSHFHVFGSEAWAHIPNEKHNSWNIRLKFLFFVGYFEDVNGYKLLQPNSIKKIIRTYVKFDENIFTYEHDSTFVPPSSCELDSTYVPYFYSPLDSTPCLVTYLDDDSDDENPPFPSLVPFPYPYLP